MTDRLVHDPVQLRELARELLSRPPYRDPAAEGVIDRLLAGLRDVLAEVLWRLISLVGGSTTTAWVLVLLGILVLLVAVWRWTRGARRDPTRRDPATGVERRTVAQWQAAADAHLAAGRRDQAVRGYYAALVAQLAESGRIEDRPGRTVRELERELPAALPALAADIQDAGRRFEAVWYGRQPADDDDVAKVRGCLADVQAALGVTVTAGAR